jgi:hypothetical protein
MGHDKLHGSEHLPGQLDELFNQSLNSGDSPTFDATNISGIVSGKVDQLHISARKATAGTILKGTPVYAVSYNIGGWLEVEEADASNLAKMPSIAITEVDLTNTATEFIVVAGALEGLNTQGPGYAVKDDLYVAPDGGLTKTKPTGTNLIQKVAEVTRVNPSNGSFEVFGAGRTNDIPNIAQDKVWKGDGSGVPQETTLNFQAMVADTLANLNTKISDLIATYGGIRDFGIGTLAQRPSAGTSGRFWWATDTDILYYDNGASWDSMGDPTRTRRYHVSQRVRVGTGGSAASTGQIQDVPVILFNATQDQECFFANHIRDTIDLSTIDPKLVFSFVSGATAPGVGTETIRLQLQIRYRGEGEGLDGAYDEDITVDIDLPTGTAYVHFDVDITLDRTKITNGDAFSVHFLRLGSHGNDDYPDDVGMMQVELEYSGTGGT